MYWINDLVIDDLVMGWLTLIVLMVAVVSTNRAAIFYAVICFVGGYLSGLYAQTDTVQSIFISGTTALILAAGCYYYRSSDDDDLAFNLFIVSGLWLITSIASLVWWFAYLDMTLLNPVFAGIMVLSIIIILIGRFRELRGNQVCNHSYMADRSPSNRWKVLDKVLLRAEAKP